MLLFVLFVLQPGCRCAFPVGRETYPACLEIVGELMVESFPGLDCYFLVKHPGSVSHGFGLDDESYRFAGVVGYFERALVVKPDQVGVGMLSGLHAAVFPGSSMSHGFSQLPQVIDHADPHGSLSVVRAYNMFSRFRFGFNARHHQQSPV
mgnify:CR=1 FL=1